ncbi:hypothetical protein BDR26DRAFT_916114 [Obelidium mucronatum]|nr:hypothetical protein BDR26DRAFT_916114 [Obelidium mucronatum]
MNSAKGVVRSVKNYTKGYSDIQIKVREATSNDPAPASQADMAAIARATHNHRDFIEIMEMLDKRLNDSGKNWRHVYKSLVLLDFLLIAGSENVIKYAKENLYVIKTLKEFMYLDEDGRDHGANVRQLSKDITAHLSDDARLREERAGQTRNHRFSGSDDEERGRYRNPDRDREQRSGNSSYGNNEDDELRRALEESKRTAEAEERRRADRNKTDSDLKKALEINERESQPAPKQAEIIDFFSPVQTAQPNLFESAQANPFGGFGSGFQQDPFAAQMQQQQMQQQMLLQQQQAAMQQEQARQLALQQEAARQQQALALQQQQQQQSLMSGFAAYDAQAASRAVAADPLFDVARNSSQIDPFANLAVSRGSVSAVGVSAVRSGSLVGASNPFGSATATPFGNSSNNSNFGTGNDVFNTQTAPVSNLFGGVTTNNSNAFASAPAGGAAKNPFGGVSNQQQFGQQQQQPSPFGSLGMPNSNRPVTSQRDFADLSPFPKANTGPIGAMGQPQQQSSPFGTQQQQPFGGFGGASTSAAQPFGTNSGNNSAFGTQQNGFGQQQQQPNAFGGAAQPFGTQQNAFGSQAQQPFGNNAFGTQPQQQQQNAFGTQQNAFGQQQQQQPFGTNQFPMPGQQQQPQFNAFGQPQQQQQQQSFF